MRDTIRYSSSALFAIAIVLITFLVMAGLIATPKYTKSVEFEPIVFSKIADQEKTQPNRPEPPKTPPKQQKIKQPPAAPKMDITETPDPTAGTRVITGIAKPKFGSFDKFAKPDILVTGDKPGNNQDLIVLVPIMPQYPIKELNKNIEGWVKVEFIVNEFGKATQIKVLDAQPKRVFDQATIRALRKSKFKPLMVNGKAVSQTAIQTIEFKLEEDSGSRF
jgi:protein TonB